MKNKNIFKKINSGVNPKNGSKLLLTQYSDDWAGCQRLINELTAYYSACLTRAFEANGKKDIGDFINYRLDNSTKINPAFYSLLYGFLNWGNFRVELDTKWENMYEHIRKPEEKILDFTDKTWVNVNSIFPNYENKGVIAINVLDTQSKNKLTSEQSGIHSWSASVANLLNIVDKFSSKDFVMKPHENRAIKYIAGEILANTFQHAFKDNGASSIGIFIDEKLREITMVISDRGISIPGSIRKHKFEKISDIESIKWALGRGHTTKDKNRQGGMGLFRVKSIVDSACGELAFRSLRGTVYSNVDGIKTNNNYYANFGTVFFMKLELDKITKESVEINVNTWEEVKGVFPNG